MINKTHNNPPDVVLELTHEQATFLVENCKANLHLGLQMVLSFQHASGTLEEKRAKAQKFIDLQEQFQAVLRKLRTAGAKEND